MSDFEFQLDNALIDTYLGVDTHNPHQELHIHVSQEKNVEMSQPQTQAPKSNASSSHPSKPGSKHHQSNLHNCPKHLIKLIIQCVGLGKQTAEQIAKQFKDCDAEVYQSIKSLLGILEMIRRNKLKTFSKQLLKIVFQNNSESVPRLKLLQNPLVGKVFEGKNPTSMCLAKEILREFAIERLTTRKDNYNDRSKNQKKYINDRYLQIFLEELKAGRIKQRISKEDKSRIFE